ncbi:MAG: HigA family addiction module antitoxin [Bacteroidaceae bacterium]|nr:HigA family addiction module antitoxin [Bacteroidaceae bacterium]
MIHLEGVNPNMIANNLTPFYVTHPGEVLKDEVECRGISQRALADQIGMSYKALNEILNERRPVTIETAMLFEAALGISAKTLLNLQMEYNMSQVRRNKTFLDRLSSIRKIAAVL